MERCRYFTLISEFVLAFYKLDAEITLLSLYISFICVNSCIKEKIENIFKSLPNKMFSLKGSSGKAGETNYDNLIVNCNWLFSNCFLWLSKQKWVFT